MQETARLKSRLKQIPIAHDYLFSDATKLIAGTDELEPIVAERIEAEKQREAELKAKAEQEALAKEQAEQAAAEKAKQDAEQTEKVQAEPAPSTQPTPPQKPAQSAVQNSGFVIRITLPPMPEDEAVAIARAVKAQCSDKCDVSLKPRKDD